jgi:hypothetical protein
LQARVWPRWRLPSSGCNLRLVPDVPVKRIALPNPG